MGKTVLFMISMVAVLLVSACGIFFLKMSGFAAGNISVGIAEKLNGRVTLDCNSSVFVGDDVTIYAEFMNTGTSHVTGRIELKVYLYNRSRLDLLATYYDSYFSLNPGMRKGYRTTFVPDQNGTYYINAKVSYETRTAETWRAFTASYPSEAPYVPGNGTGTGNGTGNATGNATGYVLNITGGGGGGAGGGLTALTYITTVLGGTPGITLSYPNKITLHQGESTMINLRVNNTGDLAVHDVKMHTSIFFGIGLDVNPKVIPIIYPNQTYSFLISLDSLNASEGDYTLSFDVMSDYASDTGSIAIKIVSWNMTAEEIEQIILNYRLIISDLKGEIFSASLKGFDTSDIKNRLDDTESMLDDAEKDLRFNKMDDAKKKLKGVKDDLEQIVLALANLTIILRAEPPLFTSTMLILLILLIIALVLLILILLRRKRKKKKPKLLQNTQETEA